ncbi:hypothetical protein X975_08492, partial [Stegodyphus mimosarum]
MYVVDGCNAFEDNLSIVKDIWFEPKPKSQTRAFQLIGIHNCLLVR